MYILRILKLKTIYLVVSVNYIFLLTLPSIVYGANWVFVKSNENYTTYYNSSSINIDRQIKFIRVLIKDVYTANGKDDFLNDNKKRLNINRYRNFAYDTTLYSINYKEMKCSMRQLTHYTKSGYVLKDIEFPSNWDDILPDSLGDYVLIK